MKKRVRLGDLARVTHGYAFDGDGFTGEVTGNILITPGNFNIGGGFKLDKPKYFRGEVPERFVLKPGDLVVTMTDLSKSMDTLGCVAIIPKLTEGARALHNQRVGKFELISDEVDRGYLAYRLRGHDYLAEVRASSSGSTVHHTSPGRIEQFEFDLPPLTDQRAIAATLGALDDKIESLQKSVRLAQDLAQSTFKTWFVSGEHWGGLQPSDWKAVKLKDICELRRDSVKAGQLTDLPYVPVDSLHTKNLAVHNWKPNSEAQSSLVRFEEDDILIGAMRVYFHRVAIAPFAGLTRTTAFTLRPKRKSYLPFSLLLCNEETTIDFAQTTSKGSTMPYAVWEGGLAGMDVLLPTEEVLEDFARTVGPLIDFVKESGKQLQSLSDIRDFLLPELLSGRIRVGEDFA